MLGTGGTLPLAELPDGFNTATITLSVRLLDDTDGSDQGATATADLQLVTTSTTDGNKNTTVDWVAPAAS